VYVSVVLPVTLLNSAAALRLRGSLVAFEALRSGTVGIEVVDVALGPGSLARMDEVVVNARLVRMDA
jgi:hypothetical protein